MLRIDTSHQSANANAPGLITRLFARLGGANPQRLALCTPDDVMVAVRTGLALVASHLFVGGALFVGLMVAVSQQQVGVVLIGAAAILLATIIILMDHTMIQASWMESGQDQIRRTRRADTVASQMDAEKPPRMIVSDGIIARVARFASVFLIRVSLSFALAFTVATVLELVIFQPDIMGRIEADRITRNAPLLREVEERVDANIARLDMRAGALANALTAAQAEEARLIRESAAQELRDAAWKSAQRAKLVEQREAALAEAQRRRAEAIAERQGVRETPSASGVPGEGARYRNASEQAKALTERAGELLREIERIDSSIGGSTGRSAELREALTAQRTRLRDLEALEAAARAELTTAATDRVASAKAMAVATEAYVPARDGLVLRLDTLAALKSESTALATFAFGLKIVLILAEMGGLISKLLSSGPSVYAAQTAADVEVGVIRAVLAADELIALNREARDDASAERVRKFVERTKQQAADRSAAQARARFDAILEQALETDAKPH